MKKEELIQLHNFLLQLKAHLETVKDIKDSSFFSSYETLNITPYEIYKFQTMTAPSTETHLPAS